MMFSGSAHVAGHEMALEVSDAYVYVDIVMRNEVLMVRVTRQVQGRARESC